MLESPSKMSWKCRLAVSGPLSPLLLALLAGFALLLATVGGSFGRSSCCPGKQRRAGFGHHVGDERAEKRKKYRNRCWFTVGYAVKKPGSCCRSTGKPLTDSRNISKYLYGFSPCPLAVSLTDANMKRFMWVPSSARAGNSLRSGSLSFCRSGPVVCLAVL